MTDPDLSSFICSVADLLRGNYKQSEYGKLVLPFTVLRHLDCVLQPTPEFKETGLTPSWTSAAAASVEQIRGSVTRHLWLRLDPGRPTAGVFFR